MTMAAIEHGGRHYLTGSLQAIDAPSDAELASWGVADALKQHAPNDKLIWLRGHYASEGANRNGQHFTADELSIKSVTSRLMPVTVMHRPRDVVGVIADSRLVVPTDEAAAEGSVTSVETVIAIWAHRFPEVAEEIDENLAAGSLMQSIEADAPAYDCSECATRFVKPVDPASHCEHLTNGSGHRTLVDVTFTGTGLIYGSRGAQGADPRAYLAEVAEWADARAGKNKSDDDKESAMKVEIDKDEYEALVATKAAHAELLRRVDVADADKKAAEDKAKEAETQATEAEVKAQEATEAKDAAEGELAKLKEERAADELAADRLSKLPAEIAKKLPEATAVRLAKKARSLDEDDWTAEVAEIAELLGVKADGEGAGEIFAETAMGKFNPNGAVDDPKTSTNAGVTPAAVAGGLATMLRDARKAKN